MPRGTAGRDDDPLELFQLIIGQVQAGHSSSSLVLQQVAAEGIADALRLLADLLQHEMGIPAAFHLGQVPVDLVDLLADTGRHQITHPVTVTGQYCHFAVVEVDHRAGVLQQRGGIGCHEPLVFSNAYQERGSLPGSDQYPGLFR
jgi:hypothetical protein